MYMYSDSAVIGSSVLTGKEYNEKFCIASRRLYQKLGTDGRRI